MCPAISALDYGFTEYLHLGPIMGKLEEGGRCFSGVFFVLALAFTFTLVAIAPIILVGGKE
jgi:hypothetical protein